jgi:hypothetical protein
LFSIYQTVRNDFSHLVLVPVLMVEVVFCSCTVHPPMQKILDLLQANTITPKDFIYRRSDYVFRLNEKAEELVIRSVMYSLKLNDIVKYTQSLGRLCIDLAPESEPLTPYAQGSKRAHQRDKEFFEHL